MASCTVHYDGLCGENCWARPKGEVDTRTALEAQFGQVWDTAELQRDYTVEGFAAPFVVVERKADGARGSLEFTHMPRFYFSFAVDK